MSFTEVTCPSGLTGRVRKLKVSEANLLADEANQRKDDAVDSVLRACWTETLAPGPYTLPESGVLDWGKVLVADRFVAILHIRIATYGSAYDFQVQCAEASCRQRFGWSIDLVKDLPPIPIPEESLQVFADGNQFPGYLRGADKGFTFGLQTGLGERAAAKLLKANRARKLTAALASRITAVDGVENLDRVRFLTALDMDDAVEAIEQMDAVDGGVETELEVECTHCGGVQEVELPLGKTFWLPKPPKSQLAGSSSLLV